MRKLFANLLIPALALLGGGCISYSYEGVSESEPTSSVEVFADSSRIGKPYRVLGTATVSGNYQDVSRERMIDKLKSEAGECGADAILLVEQQVVPGEYQSGANPVFMTAYDYDDTSRSWSQIYRDVDQTYGRVEWRQSRSAGVGAGVMNYRRVIRAEFLKFTGAPVPEASGDTGEDK